MAIRFLAFAVSTAACLLVNAANAPAVVRTEPAVLVSKPVTPWSPDSENSCYFVLRIKVDATGAVSDVQVAERGFANRKQIASAISFVQRYKFKAASRNGVAVETELLQAFSISASDSRVSPEVKEESRRVVDLIAAGDIAGAIHHAEYMLSDVVRSSWDYLGLQGTIGQAYASAGNNALAISALRRATRRSKAAPKFELEAVIPKNDAANYAFNNKNYILSLLDLKFRLAAKQGYFLEALHAFRDLSGLAPMSSSDPRVALARVLTQSLKSDDELIGSVTLVPGSYDDKGAWSHMLYRRSFTFDKVQGQISKLELSCDGESRELTYGEGLEWSVPANWEDCSVGIEGQAGTTLQVVEFAD
jgi:hypothetical protein